MNTMMLDKNPMMDANNQPVNATQNNFTAHFNSINGIMASAADYYNTVESNNHAFISSVQDDLKGWIMTSDRIIYSPNSLEANIISYYGSTIIHPVERKILVPQYRGTSLANVLQSRDGLKYIQSLFNTTDSAEKLAKTLKMLSGKDSDKIDIWTPSQNIRKELNSQVTLTCAGFTFRIICDNDPYSVGSSRLVSNIPLETVLDVNKQEPLDEVLSFSKEYVSSHSWKDFESGIKNIYKR